MKWFEIHSLVSKINKPIDIGYHSSEGILEHQDYENLGMVPEHQPFSLFDERYYKEVKQVLKLLMKAKDFKTFIKTAKVLHERVNEDLLYYCLSVAILHRNDTQGINILPVQDVYPDKFLKLDIIKKMKMVSKYPSSERFTQMPVVDATRETINYKDKNNDLNYFLEDIGMNSGHYQWHVLNPAIWWRPGDYDWKGEQFYWMHKQMVCRYDAERLSNYKKPVEPFNNWDEPILDGYAPHLRIDKLGYRYAFRPPLMVLSDVKGLSKSKMLMWEERLMKAALRGFALADNDTGIDLNNEDGIDVLGGMVESSLTSVNPKFYGNLHNYAHVMAGKITDPKGVHDGAYGVMYDVPTSARDPLFYAWHKYINRIFETHKNQLPPYTKKELEFKDVKITNFTIKGVKDNVVHTSWEESLFVVSQGFTFTKNSEVAVKVKHLQHETFNYTIEVENSGPARKAIVRIYGLPYISYYSKMNFNQLRKRNIELDIFTTDLVSGNNIIVRSSKDSSIVRKDIYSTHKTDDSPKVKRQCHCTWPDYMLLPKGTYEGMPFSTVVVINDWDEEKVEQASSCRCVQTGSYCDVDRKPFKRALGFPFDRRGKVNHFDELKTPNMARTVIKIKFTGKTTYST